jgi:hypothetical protein
VSKALEEKQRLIADILHIPIDDFDNIVDIASQPSPDRDAREVLLAALAQGKSSIALTCDSEAKRSSMNDVTILGRGVNDVGDDDSKDLAIKSVTKENGCQTIS